MLTISKMVSEEYYVSLAAEDYYLNGGEPPGRWIGSGAEFFGLSGIVQVPDFRALYRGLHPQNGSKLIQSAGKRNHVPGWDFTFSAPKSVSVYWSRAPLKISRLVQQAQQEAVQEAITFAEQHFAISRTGHAGSGEQAKVGLTVATFEHGTSRALDPQLHTHCLVFNVGVAEDGTTRSIHSPLLFQRKMVLGAYYRAALAHRLEKHLGIRTRRHGHSFEIVGVPQEIIDDNSKRRKQILKKMHEEAQSGAKAAQRANLQTREKKDVPPRMELFHRWQERYDKLGFTAEDLEHLTSEKVRNNRRFIPQSLESAIENITINKPFFRAKDFLFEALCAAAEYGIAPHDMLRPVNEILANVEQVLPMHQDGDETVYTTPAALKEEHRLLATASEMVSRRGAKVSNEIVQNTLEEHNTLVEEQRAAYHHLLQSKSSVRFLHGMAGTGKTSYVLKACISAWKKAGYRMIGAAPTGKAAEVLQDEAGIPCDTIHRTLGNLPNDDGLDFRHQYKKLIRPAKRKKTPPRSNRRPVLVDKKTILIVDEAGMVNSRHFQMLMEHVLKGGGTLVFLGDPHQLPPVEGTAPFLSLSRRVGYRELTDIKRQKEIWARAASRLFAQGEAGQALAMYADQGLITTCDDVEAALESLLDDWSKIGLTTPAKAVIITLTNAECDEANRICQQRRITAGCVRQFYTATATDTREDGDRKSRVYLGDRVLFTKNSKKYGVRNGSLGTVIDITPQTNSVRVTLDNGRVVDVSLDKFPHVRLGYAMTTYRAQGTTLKDAFLLVGGYMQDLPSSYVQATRASGTSRFYTTKELLDDFKNAESSVLAEQMSRRPDLRIASDLYDFPDYASLKNEKVIRTLLADWLPAYRENPLQAFIFTDNEEQATRLNERCHEHVLAQAATEWKPPPTTTTPNGVELVAGAKIRFEREMHLGRIQKGDLATVTRVFPDRGSVELLDNRLNELRQVLVKDLDAVRHAYANQISDLKWLYAYRLQQARQQKTAFRYTERYEPHAVRQTQQTDLQQPVYNPAAWGNQPILPAPPVPIEQKQYACIGGPAMQMYKLHMQGIQEMHQRIESQTEALSQTQVQRNTWYDSIQQYKESHAQAQ